MLSVACMCERIGRSTAERRLLCSNKRDTSALVLHGEVLGSLSEPLNIVVLLSVGFNEPADASRLDELAVHKSVASVSELCSCVWRDGMIP